MNSEYDEYRCKKAIKNQVVTCKSCNKLFDHPGCVSKHRVYDRNRDLVQCTGPYDKFTIESEREEETKMSTSSVRNRIGSTGSTGSITTPSSGNRAAGTTGSSNIDFKIDWLIRVVKEMKNEIACKEEIKMMIKEVVQEEVGNVKQELDDLRKMIQGGIPGPSGGSYKSYSETVKEKKKENIIIIKPNVQQESEATKKLIKEKVDIKNMAMGITKLRKGSKGTVILGCETGEEIEKLKTTVQAKLGENFKVTESPQIKPKIKIVNIDEEDIQLDDNDLIDTIKKQNQVTTNKETHMRIVKKITKEKRNYNNQAVRRGGAEGVVIMEADERTHELMLNKGKINIGWKKCPVFNHINVKRCFKCWGYFHIAKNCTRNETCHKCAGKHKAVECKVSKKKCVNCMFKVQTYNLKINDEHDALDPECPTYKRAIQEERKRAGWDENK